MLVFKQNHMPERIVQRIVPLKYETKVDSLRKLQMLATPPDSSQWPLVDKYDQLVTLVLQRVALTETRMRCLHPSDPPLTVPPSLLSSCRGQSRHKLMFSPKTFCGLVTDAYDEVTTAVDGKTSMSFKHDE